MILYGRARYKRTRQGQSSGSECLTYGCRGKRHVMRSVSDGSGLGCVFCEAKGDEAEPYVCKSSGKGVEN